MKRMIIILVNMMIFSSSLWSSEIQEFRPNTKMSSSFLYISSTPTEALGGKVAFVFGTEHSFLVGGSFLTHRKDGDINFSDDFWQTHLGYLYQRDNFTPYGEQTIIKISGFFNGQTKQETIKGISFDYHAPYQIDSDWLLTPFAVFRLETEEKNDQGIMSWNVGLRTRFQIPESGGMYIGGQLDVFKNLSSYDTYGVFPYQDIPVMAKIGGLFDYEWNETLRYHAELSGALFFQTGKYFEATGSIELLKALHAGAYVNYRYNETQSNKALATFKKMWQIGVYINF